VIRLEDSESVMIDRWGLGPVFEAEWLANSRRWQFYAGRMLFVTLVLIGLSSVWFAHAAGLEFASIQKLAELGQAFYRSIVFTQLMVVLIAAPAATAGAICQGKLRGNLAQELITDLSDAEIVLGKLAARLIPMLGMVCCTLPVLALCTLLGGVDPLALSATFAITLTVAIFGCCVALAVSVWGTKPYEVLLATFTIFACWLLALPIWENLAWAWSLPHAPWWAMVFNPFDLALAPTYRPRDVHLLVYVGFVLAMLGLSALLVVVAILRLRAVAIGQADGSFVRHRGRRLNFRFGRLRIASTPSLDDNPSLWYEWHRTRPTPWIRKLLRLYAGSAIAFSAIAILDALAMGGVIRGWIASYVNAFMVAIGLPLLVITATTAMVEERSRGSLDILLTTPLSSRGIVLAKWWSVFQQIAFLLVLPAINGVVLAWGTDQWPLVGWAVLYLLACGAGWTSIGLALSTWISRLGRAVFTAVALYTIFSLGLPVLATTIVRGPDASGLSMISPFYALFYLTLAIPEPQYVPSFFVWNVVWTVFWMVMAVGFLVATLATFDRCLGRLSERARRKRPSAVQLAATASVDPALDRAAQLAAG
jgi:ABC-type transport system involved in multi-copper enzyme maturation permease subunit